MYTRLQGAASACGSVPLSQCEVGVVYRPTGGCWFLLRLYLALLASASGSFSLHLGLSALFRWSIVAPV